MSKGLRKASVASFEVKSRNFEKSKPRKSKVQEPPTFLNHPNTKHASYNMRFGTNIVANSRWVFNLSILVS